MLFEGFSHAGKLVYFLLSSALSRHIAGREDKSQGFLRRPPSFGRFRVLVEFHDAAAAGRAIFA